MDNKERYGFDYNNVYMVLVAPDGREVLLQGEDGHDFHHRLIKSISHHVPTEAFPTVDDLIDYMIEPYFI
jgi:hypothetical protein